MLRVFVLIDGGVICVLVEECGGLFSDLYSE